MRNRTLLLILLNVNIAEAQQYGSFTDNRDGRKYKTVKIGTQLWMAENLNTDKFDSKVQISQAKTNEEWMKAGKDKKPAWCHYFNDPKMKSINYDTPGYNKLYNWYAVTYSNNICPIGWHIPTYKDWDVLSEYLGGQYFSGSLMKKKYNW